MAKAWSNTWVNTPLSVANLFAAIDNMKACVGTPLAIQSDVLIVPPGLIEECIASAWRALTRLVRNLAEPIKRGRYEQRQRRHAQGVWASRFERRMHIERQIVGLLKEIEMLEKL